MMFLLFPIILFELILPTKAGITIDRTLYKTTYVWMPDAANPLKGQCYEIDMASRGEKFNAKVNQSNCKPKEVSYLWAPEESGIGGRCFAVDAKTGTNGYVEGTDDRKCYPENVTYHLIESTCYAKGTLKTGGELINKVDMNECRPSESRFEFRFSKTRGNGSCYEVDAREGGAFERQVSLTKCKPKLTRFVYDQTSDTCYEVDQLEGAEGYVASVSRSKCLDQDEESFAFSNGECFRKTKDIEGNEVVLKTKDSDCRPNKTDFIFEFSSRYNGTCYEVDSLTKGNVYRSRVPHQKCRPEKTLHTYVYEIKKCLEIDEETKGGSFVMTALDRECQSVAEKAAWVADERDIYQGKCMGVVAEGNGTQKEVSYQVDKCRPSDVKTEWVQTKPFDGKCYEVDKEKGPRGYSKLIGSSKCTPLKNAIVFENVPGQTLGVCTMVDEETKGRVFKKEVSATLCKKEMGLVSP